MNSPKQAQPKRATIVALTGFMASGKTTVGRHLAKLLRWRFVDLDSEIERRARKSVAEIFAAQGEARFRELETETLRKVLAHAKTPHVIALGGGTYVQPQNAELLRSSTARVVFLELPFEQLMMRCRAAADRTLLNPRPLAKDEHSLRALYDQRLPFYRQAHITANTEGKTPDGVAREIATVLKLSENAASKA